MQPSQPSAGFDQLPTDVISLVASFLHPHEIIASLQFVSRHLHVVSQIDAVWAMLPEARALQDFAAHQEVIYNYYEDQLAKGVETWTSVMNPLPPRSEVLMTSWAGADGRNVRRLYEVLARNHNCWPLMRSGAFSRAVDWLARMKRVVDESGMSPLALGIGAWFMGDAQPPPPHGTLTRNTEMPGDDVADVDDDGHRRRRWPNSSWIQPIYFDPPVAAATEKNSDHSCAAAIDHHLAALWFLCPGQCIESSTINSGLFGTSSVYNNQVSLALVAPYRDTLQGSSLCSASQLGTPVRFLEDILGDAVTYGVTTLHCDYSYRTQEGHLETTQLPPGTVIAFADQMRSIAVVASSVESFMDRHVRDLEDGVFELEIRRVRVRVSNTAVNSTSVSISRFASRGGNFGSCMSRCVTNGVEITVRPLLMIEACAGLGSRAPHRYHYAYEVFMRLLPSAPFERCQLTDRTWRIQDMVTGHAETVGGPGVIGAYPILQRLTVEEAELTSPACDGPAPSSRRRTPIDRSSALHRKTFVYCSQTSFDSPLGKMWGAFTFVVGTIDSPEGERFEARINEFTCAYDFARVISHSW